MYYKTKGDPIMPDFTCKENNTKTPLETYEWDDLWWDHPEDKLSRRILIIGDSISRGYRGELKKLAGRDFYVDGIAGSKAADNESFYTLIDYFSQSDLEYDAVFFNNGLHGWHLDDATEYKENLSKLATYVREKFEPRTFFIVLTTPVRKSKQTDIFDEDNERVKMRNTSVKEVARELGAETSISFRSLKSAPNFTYRMESISPRTATDFSPRRS